MKLRVVLVLSLLSGVAACTTTPGTATVGGGGGSGAPGGGTGGGAGGMPSTDVPLTTTATAVTRKYALDIFSKPGQTSYLVGDRNSAGGQQVSVGEVTIGGARQGEFKAVAGDQAMEGGDAFASSVAAHDGSVKTVGTLDETVHTYYTVGFQNATLGIADYEYARGVSSFLLNTTTQEAYIATAYGGVDDNQTNAAPTASATYTGEFGAQAITRDGVAGVGGDLTLNADLSGAAATVSGRIDNLEIVDQMGNEIDPQGAYFDLQSAQINGTTYAGDVVLRDGKDAAMGDFATALPGVTARSVYQGGFFGPNGEETAGAVDMTGTMDGERYDLIGVFVGRK